MSSDSSRMILGRPGMSYSNQVVLMRAALRHALPTFVGVRDYVEAGGLLSLNHDSSENDRIVAYLVDKILQGANPAGPCSQSICTIVAAARSMALRSVATWFTRISVATSVATSLVETSLGTSALTQPLGILNAPRLITVAKESGQAARCSCTFGIWISVRRDATNEQSREARFASDEIGFKLRLRLDA